MLHHEIGGFDCRCREETTIVPLSSRPYPNFNLNLTVLTKGKAGRQTILNTSEIAQCK
jgi:hypothetical protein